jgi:ankyrin repeat protein
MRLVNSLSCKLQLRGATRRPAPVSLHCNFSLATAERLFRPSTPKTLWSYNIRTPARAMASTPSPLNVPASDLKYQTEAQGASVEMQARFFVADSDDAQIGTSDAASGLIVDQVNPSVFADGGSTGPLAAALSDAAEAEKRMLDAIEAALEHGPRAVVEAMWIGSGQSKIPFNDLIESKIWFEELPIAAACAMGQSLAVISKLMEAFPDHVSKKDKKYGYTALIYAVRSRDCNAAVIELLLKAYPEAAREKNNTGYLPLHFAAMFCRHHNAAVISELLKAYPDAVLEESESGQLPLHIAAERSDAAVIVELLKAYPDGACQKVKSDKAEKEWIGALPLHLASNRNSSAEVIAVLLKAYPNAAREKCSHSLPLHLALQNSFCNAAFIAELLKAYPGAAREKNYNGSLPLHFAAHHSKSFAVIAELLKAYPVVEVLTDFPGLVDGHDATTLNVCLIALSRIGDLPCIMLKNFQHPLHACIRLSAELMALSRRQRSKDVRLANDADEKAAELEQLACAIARNCEDNSLFGQEMDDCLQLGADLKLKFFISEPACSSRIEALWGENMWSTYHPIFVAYTVIFWLSGLNFAFNLSRDFGYMRAPPLARFLMNRASYFAFLVCLLQLPLQADPSDPVNNLGLEIFLVYWLFDICFSEVAEFRGIMKKHRLTALKAVAKYAEDPWNVYDVISLSTAVAAAFVRGLVHAGVGDTTAAASNQLYAWALALLWGRLVNVLSVVSLIGPLLIMVLVMVFRDLTKFAFLVVLMELPFVVALYFLESGDGGNEAFATFPDSALSFFKIVIGQGPDIGSVTASSSILLSIGSVLLSVLLLNLLIAMFSKTFDTIVENSTQEYLLQKAQLTFTWMRAPRMPPPFSCALALRDLAANTVARHVWRNIFFAVLCSGFRDDERDDEPPLPIFDRLHFHRITFPKRLDYETQTNPGRLKVRDTEYMQECEAKYEAWCEQVLADFNENAEFNSEAQMDKFKSRMLRGMETTVQSSGKIDQIAENAKYAQEVLSQNQILSSKIDQIAENAKATQEQGTAIQEQFKALSDAVQSQHIQIQQMHTSMQLILQKLNS